MIAMDVVDTLRHDEQFAERELDEASRRKKLIERLREIYRGQGIDVPDRILEEGVHALDEQRFVYTPPKDGWAAKLAKLYVTRHDWGRMAAGIVLGIALVWIAWYAWVDRPRAQRAAAARIELSETLPKGLRADLARIEATGANEALRTKAARIMDQGLKAAAAGDRKSARAAKTELARLLSALATHYTIRVVNRRGAVTGFSRVPKVNPNARNSYIVVEAIDEAGNVLPQLVVNEETGKRERVSVWAVRVPRRVYTEIRADKADDGIIQRTVVAIKQRGKAEPDWKIEVSGGALTQWSRR